MLTGPDSSRCVEEFESLLVTPNLSPAHHEEAHSLQVKYRKDGLAFVEIVQTTRQSLCSWSRACRMKSHGKEVIKSLSRVVEVGADLHAQYVSHTFDKVSVPVSNTIRRNKILTFSNRPDLTKKDFLKHCCAEEKHDPASQQSTRTAISASYNCVIDSSL